MPNVDVSDVLSDPDFVGPISIISRTPTINFLGEQTLQDSSRETVGSVQPADFKTVKKAPEALQNENLMSFWVKGLIIVSGTNQYPDILVFQGVRFEVKTVSDWSSWGAGWAEGLCVAEALV